MKKIVFYSLLLVILENCSGTSNRKLHSATANHSGTFVLAENWPSFPAKFVMGTPPGIGIDSHQNIFVFQRALDDTELSVDGLVKENTILMLDNSTGKILASWGSNQFKKPHGLSVDQNDNIWLTDVTLQQIFKFSHDGQLLMTIGEKDVPGKDRKHFDQPTDVAVSSDGSFYVTDGYGNNRVVKFSPEGEYLFEWGIDGKNEEEFNLPHAIDIDQAGNLYVADRENKRIQMFDANGTFLKMWDDPSFGSIQSLALDKLHHILYAVDFKVNDDKTPIGSDIIIIDLKSGETTKINHNNDLNTPPSRYHDLTVDKNGNLFIADILLNRIHRFNNSQGK